MKIVVTIVGEDRVGIIAMVSTVLAEHGVNVLSVNQNIIDGFFNMVMIAEMKEGGIKIPELQKILSEKGKADNLEIKVQHQEIFNVMHSI